MTALGVALGVGAFVGLAYGLALWFWTTAYFPVDSGTYWLAGLRLESGGKLYDLRPVDWWWPWADRTFPLYGPPLMGAVGRLLVLLGPWAFIGWLVAAGSAALWAVLVVLLSSRGWIGLLVLLLTPSLVLLIGVGNVDGPVLAMLVLAWFVRRNDGLLGSLVGVAVSLKLTPATLVVWLLVHRRWRALLWATGSSVVLACLTVWATDQLIFVRYLGVMATGTTTGRWWALLLVAAGLVAMVVFRKRPAVTYAIAILLIPLGSPQAAGHSWAMLVAAGPPITELLRRGQSAQGFQRATRTTAAPSDRNE